MPIMAGSVPGGRQAGAVAVSSHLIHEMEVEKPKTESEINL